ncbi:hypothetical protein B0I35DRAFT_5959 [Stachybotrys elegans]|uniref:Uncharacterized protein n=1 Tax=Stachybotrys elegans TaxID=80388 RepID=A0A8K0WXM5_9HYPO|nr:hypothetical protein B0I35DRAFT_5959 [Stachybotrys elegans]
MHMIVGWWLAFIGTLLFIPIDRPFQHLSKQLYVGTVSNCSMGLSACLLAEQTLPSASRPRFTNMHRTSAGRNFPVARYFEAIHKVKKKEKKRRKKNHPPPYITD